ncbi:MAG: efflux RND transporter periplasmic adaptor subunit [Cyanobacteria bacterium J06627_28]
MSYPPEPPSTSLPENEPSNTDKTNVSRPWWRKSAKPLLGVGVFVILSTGILFITHMFGSMDGHDMGGHDMGGMDHGMDGHDMGGHDMGGMSHDDMMRVDGAFNATPVTVEAVQPAPLDVSVNYTGAIYPYSEVTVYPRVAGQLSNYEIYPGDRVNAGQLLASPEATERNAQTNEAQSRVTAMLATVEASQLEMEEQQQEIDQVQADLDYLRLQRDRFARLTAEGATSQDQYDQIVSQVTAKEAMLEGAFAKRDRMQAKVVSDQAQVQQAQAQAGTATTFESYTQITAPIGGIVQERMADPGVVVQPGMGIFKIGDYQQVRLRANVAQQDANRIQIGTPITAQVPGGNAGVIRGEITSIFPQTDMTTRTVTVEAVVDNPDEQLLSGQFVDMEIITARRPRALSVPQTALSEFEGRAAVWVLSGEMAQRREVTTGMSSGDPLSEGQGQRIEITTGLKAGDRVITSGHSRLMENSTVTVVAL